jgi:hypothetical protein
VLTDSPAQAAAEGGRALPEPGREAQSRGLMIASIGYLDESVKQGDSLFFAQRELMVDWTENRRSAG